MTDSTPLVDRNCTRAGRDARALTAAERAELVPQTPDWRIDDHSGIARLERVFTFKNFVEALASPMPSAPWPRPKTITRR